LYSAIESEDAEALVVYLEYIWKKKLSFNEPEFSEAVTSTVFVS